MPYYRHKIITNNKNYSPLRCQEVDTKPKFIWHRGLHIDIAFQAKDVEKQYQLCTMSEKRWNLQLASILYLILSIILVIYFSIDYSSSNFGSMDESSTNLLYTAAASTAANTLLLVVMYILSHHSLFISSIFMLLIGAIPSFTYLYFWVLTSVTSNITANPVYLIFIWSCPILISISLLYLPFLILIVSGFIYSAGISLHAHIRGTDNIFVVWTFLSLTGTTLIAIYIRFYEEITSRRVFYTVGRSLVQRQNAQDETLLKEVLIRSIMPAGVCTSILASGMLHDVVVGKDPESMMRNLPIKMMDPVSILFADLVGFTAMSSTLEAQELVSLLTDLYGRFDCVAEAYSCENISILGDCYFAVSGCPEPDERHADNCMYTGIGLIKATREFCLQRSKSIDIRVGIHTGIVLCGIVGGTKFKYDVWSSDAKLANLMESGGVPGRVHISEQTKEYLQDQWEFEEGFGSRREPELQGMSTYLLLKDFQDSVLIEPVKKDISDTAIFQTVQKTLAKKRCSGAGERGVVAGREFDGSVPLHNIITNEELLGSYDLLPNVHPAISFQEKKGLTLLNGTGNSYKCMTNTSVSPVHNGDTANGHSHEVEEKPDITHRQQLVPAAAQSWNLHRTFKKEEKFAENKKGCSVMVNPLTAIFRSNKLKTDYLRHGWTDKGCMCIFSRGFSFFSTLIMLIVSLISLVIVIRPPNSGLPIILVEIIANSVIGSILLVLFARWKRFKHFNCLEKLNCIPYPVTPILTSVMVLVPTFVSMGLMWPDSGSEHLYLVIPVILTLSHFLLHEKSALVLHMLFIIATTVFTAFYISMFSDGSTQNKEFGIAGLVCVFITVSAILWVKSVKSALRFGTLQECSTELSVVKEEEKVTTQLFNTIIPKHVSEVFLSDLRYSHSYDNVGVIFASVTNFWEFYEEKFEGGMGCIRVLNEIVRDIDDLLSALDNTLRKSDPRWVAIQKIKTIGPCYMAASGLDPVTEEQTRQGNHEHIVHLMDFCFKILETIEQFNRHTFGTKFLMKIGFNYGPVTDGIIGQNKVLYDIWGDTVNLASRMMSTGVNDRIAVPAACLPYLLDHFKLPKRGKVYIKGKGDMIVHFCTARKTTEQIKANLEARAAKKINSTDA